MQPSKKSRQRDAILLNLQNRSDHPTAMELYLSVRQDFPNLSLGTLYRNLKGLCENGTIINLSVGGEEHYDACTEAHYHLKCDVCGRFYDLPTPPLEALETFSPEAYGGTIRGYSLIFFGTCAHCTADTVKI